MIGLDPRAWSLWCAYRKEIRKPLSEKKPISYEAAQRKLASFGPDQMAVVERSIENGWQGLFPLPAAMKEAQRKMEARQASERIEWQNLAERASRAGFRQPTPMDDLGGYRTLVERAEANQPRSSNVVSIGALVSKII